MFDIEKARQAEELAAQCLSDLCHARRRWEMHIPLQSDDPDVLLGDALGQLRGAIKEVEQQRQRAEAAEAKLAANTDELKRLMADTDVVLSELNPQEIKGAINWGDLFAAEVTRVFDADHRTWLRIVIEEVSPGTETLIDAVRVGLAAKGWDVTGIAIETEW